MRQACSSGLTVAEGTREGQLLFAKRRADNATVMAKGAGEGKGDSEGSQDGSKAAAESPCTMCTRMGAASNACIAADTLVQIAYW